MTAAKVSSSYLTMSMRATSWVIISWITFFAAAGIADSGFTLLPPARTIRLLQKGMPQRRKVTSGPGVLMAIGAGTGSLTADMKACMALILGFLVFWVVDTVGFLWTTPSDIGALLSLVVLTTLYVVFLYFAWRRKPWAYLGNSVFSTFMLVVTVVGVSFGTQPFKWDVVMSVVFLTVIFALLSLESFKAYVETKNP